MIDYEVKRKHFSICKLISWEDVIDKLSYEFSQKTHKTIIADLLNPPTFVMHTNYLPNSIGDAYKEVCNSLESNMEMHIYTSLGSQSDTFGRHKDKDDVIIVQSIGQVEYKFDDGCSFVLHPGDSLFIKRGVYHNPIVLGPRVTLSFSWLN